MKKLATILALSLSALCLLASPQASAVPVTIDTGSYTGQWDMDIDGNFVSGSQTRDLAPGPHRIRAGTYAQILFSVDASGNVTLAPEYDGISASGGSGTLSLLTVPVQVNPGDYEGKWEISRVQNPTSGNRTVRLVPTEQTNQDGSIGGEYRLSFGLASSAIKVNLRADGSMTFSDGDNAFAGAVFDDSGVLKFRNTNITVTDRDASGLSWIINQVTPSFGEPGTPSGNLSLTVVPEVEYQFQAGASVTWFTVSDPCAVDPSEQNIGGVFFDITCGVEPGFFAPGNLFVANSDVKIYDPSGTLVGAIDDPALDQSGDIEFNYVRDVLYVADRQGGEVFVFDTGGNLVQVIGPAPGESVAWGTAIDSVGTSYVVGAGGRVNVFDNDGTYQRTISGAFSCCGIQAALSPDGNTLYVTETSGFNKGIHAWDVANGDTYLGFIGNTATAFSLTVGVATGPDGSIYVGDGGVVPGSGTLVKLTPDGFVESIIATGLNAPFGIAVDGSNQVWVAEANKFVAGEPKILGFDANGDPVGGIAPYPEVGQPVGLEFYLPPVEPVETTYLFDFDITISRYLGTDPAIAAQLPALGMASGRFTYDPAAFPVPSPIVGTDYNYSPAGTLGLEIEFGNGVTWSTSPTGDFVARVIDRAPGSGADVVRFFSGTDAEISVSGLSTDEIFLQFVETTGNLLTDEALPASFELADWPGVNNIDLRATDGNNSEYRIFGTLTNLRLAGSNEAPTADAGNDQSIRAGDLVLLDGSASFDDNTSSANLVYSWSFASLPAGSSASLSGASTATPSFVADVADTYVLELIVTDEGELSSAPDDVVVSSDNLAPTANAGDDQLVIVGTTATLDGTASSDPEMNALTFAWTVSGAPTGSTAAVVDAGTSMASLSPDLEGTYEITLDVSDAIGPGAPDTAQITATTAESFSETQIVNADVVVNALNAGQVTTSGNQNALGNFLDQAVAAIQDGDISKAIGKLEKAIERTDGCVLRGSPDGSGKGRDWITDCAAQSEIYELLSAALDALSQ